MNEETEYEVMFSFKQSRDHLTVTMLESEVDTMFDRLWERDSIKWINIWEHIINLEDVQYVRYEEIEKAKW